MAGALLPVKVPEIQLTTFDKIDDVGGSWHENSYSTCNRIEVSTG